MTSEIQFNEVSVLLLQPSSHGSTVSTVKLTSDSLGGENRGTSEQKQGKLDENGGSFSLTSAQFVSPQQQPAHSFAQDEGRRCSSTQFGLTLFQSSEVGEFEELYRLNIELCKRKALLREFFCFWCCRFLVNHRTMPVTDKKKARGSGAVCYAAPLTARNLQWISTISSV